MKINRRPPVPGEYRFRSIFLGLILAVVVTSAGILFFMQRAMSNEQLAARQRLLDFYRGHMAHVRGELERFAKETHAALIEMDPQMSASATFARLINAGYGDAIVCFDEVGRLLYPSQPAASEDLKFELDMDWQLAEALEYQHSKPLEAAEKYAVIVERAGSMNVIASAIQAQARCLAKAQETDAAINLLKKLGGEQFRQAIDSQGRLIAPGGLLMVLSLMDGRSGFQDVAALLEEILNDYQNPAFPASQRRFLMRELNHLLSADLFPLLEAEELAASWIERGGLPGKAVFEKSPIEGVWQISGPQVTALFYQKNLMDQLIQLAEAPTEDFYISFFPPGVPTSEDALEVMPAGPGFPGWRLALFLSAHTNAQMEAEENTAFYLWLGLLVVGAICLIAGATTKYILGQLSSTRLKNDLLATVSHELKTPLSSVRMLVDTLLDGHYKNEEITREYLELIARENRRLSRLIDNFLDFSKMERRQTSFEMRKTPPKDVVDAAMETMEAKLIEAGFSIEVEIEENLPEMVLDIDAISRVLINLLDNARKYTHREKYIRLSVRRKGRWLQMEVLDKGIGMSRRETKRVFERFFQADRSLARKADGVGLGLNIVQRIIDAHGGKMKVESQVGKGSVFTVMLPIEMDQGNGVEKTEGFGL